jgi:hypothetical protein
VLVSAASRDDGTTVDVIDPADGKVLESGVLPGRLRVRAVSFSGYQAALMPRSYNSDLGRAEGRSSTRIVVARFDGVPAKTFDVPANVEPEAFSSDGSTLFVVEYRPARNPDRYTLRGLDLETGKLGPEFIDDTDVDDMQGIAQTQALSADGSVLSTLYTKDDGHAFVHVLNLDSKLPNCVDLPQPFGRDPEAMAIASVGDRLFVVDTASDRVAEVNTRTLRVDRTERVPKLRLGEQGHVSAAASANALYVGRGDRVVGLGVVQFHQFGSWKFRTPVRGLQMPGEESPELYVAERRKLSVLDATSGTRMEQFTTPPGDGVRHVGYVLPQTSIGVYQCAC